MMKNAEEFLETELGAEMQEAMKALNCYLEQKSHTSEYREPEKFRALQKDIDILLGKVGSV